MPVIRPASDMRDKLNEISEYCRMTREPVFLTKDGVGDMVVMSMEDYELLRARIDLYGKLAEAENEAASGEDGADFFEFAEKLRTTVHGKIQDKDIACRAV